MFRALRKRLTYANIAMTLALVFAMAGGAYAAGKFVVTSTKQIKPSVLAQLKGKAGPAGPQGPQGPQGPAGTAGANGKDQAGPFQTVPHPGPILAARGRAGAAAARVPPRRHGQGADAVPPGRRPGPG